MEAGTFSLLGFKPGKMARLNLETFSYFLKLGVCWENYGLIAHRRAEEAFVLTSLAEAHFPPSPHPSESFERLHRPGISSTFWCAQE